MSADRFADLSDGIRLCHRTRGESDGVPLVLVSGLACDLTWWPEALLDGLADRGFRVVHFDNRDCGRSTTVEATPPSTWRQLLARPRSDAYTLADMAEDTVGLMDHLGIEQAHLVGGSMGGMIAQTVAATHPQRVRTLTSMLSTTGATKIGQPARSTLWKLLKPPAGTRQESVARHLAMVRHLAGTAFPVDEATETALAEGVWDRAGGAEAGPRNARQIQAIQASGDRTAQLRRITAPTLVVHGDRDLIVHPSGGRATAQAIPGARHVTVPGMGHHFAAGAVPHLVDLITQHTQHASAEQGAQS
ncbi:MAG: alpha/beta hydrolase fold protein [Marmoricola sp.]|nr:alpha/beta hydrolase fold protein [Marmoricola sp.]